MIEKGGGVFTLTDISQGWKPDGKYYKVSQIEAFCLGLKMQGKGIIIDNEKKGKEKKTYFFVFEERRD